MRMIPATRWRWRPASRWFLAFGLVAISGSLVTGPAHAQNCPPNEHSGQCLYTDFEWGSVGGGVAPRFDGRNEREAKALPEVDTVAVPPHEVVGDPQGGLDAGTNIGVDGMAVPPQINTCEKSGAPNWVCRDATPVRTDWVSKSPRRLPARPSNEDGARTEDHVSEGEARGSDPVNPTTGEFVVHATDLTLSGLGGMNFALSRVYRSGTDFDGPLGFGWDHNYNQRVVLLGKTQLGDACHGDPEEAGQCTPAWATGDGSTVFFHLDGASDTSPFPCPSQPTESCVNRVLSYSPVGAGHQQLTWTRRSRLNADGSQTLQSQKWVLSNPDGGFLEFDWQGLLVRVENNAGVALTLSWGNYARGGAVVQEVQSVVDSVGRTISFGYVDGYLSSVVEPVSGLSASYEVDTHGDLVSATDQLGVTETYGYDTEPREDLEDHVPEDALYAACEDKCSSDPGSEGICEGVGQDAWVECHSRCDADGETCQGNCAQGCETYCASEDAATSCADSCGGACDGKCSALVPTSCSQMATSEPVREACFDCRRHIRDDCKASCGLAGGCQPPGTMSIYVPVIFWSPEAWIQSWLHTVASNFPSCHDGAVYPSGYYASVFGSEVEQQMLAAGACTEGPPACEFQGCPTTTCEYTKDDYSECANSCTLCKTWEGEATSVDFVAGCRTWAPGDSGPGSSLHDPEEPELYEYWYSYNFGGAPGSVPQWQINDMIGDHEDAIKQQEFENEGSWDYDPDFVPAGNGLLTPCEYRCAFDYAGDCVEEQLSNAPDACPATCKEGCGARCINDCVPTCTEGCPDRCANDVAACHTACDELGTNPGSWEDTCVRQCKDLCLQAGRRGSSTDEKRNLPKYGHPSDLQHNLTHITNADGVTYVVNTYGQDIYKPSFDRVIRQDNAGQVLELAYRDLRAEHDLVIIPAEDWVEFEASGDAVGGLVEGITEMVVPQFCEPCTSGEAFCDFGFEPTKGIETHVFWLETGGWFGPRLPVRATVVRDPYGEYTTYYLDKRNRLLRKVSFDGSGATMPMPPAANGPEGPLLTPGQGRWYQYDDGSVHRANQGLLTGVLDFDGDRVCNQRDDLGNVTLVTALPYHGTLDSLQASPKRVDHGVQLRFDFEPAPGVSYNGPNRLHATYLPKREPEATWQLATRFSWSNDGVLESTETLSGLTTSYVNTSFGLPEYVIAPNGSVTEVGYDLDTGTIDYVVEDATGAEPLLTDYQADSAGRPTGVVSPTGVQTDIQYVEFGREHLVTVSDTSSGRLVQRRELYDLVGDLVRIEGDVTDVDLEYDLLGRLRKRTVSAGDGSEQPLVSCTLFGPDGRLLRSIAEDGLRTRRHYDYRGRMVSVTQAGQPSTLEASFLGWDDGCPLLDTSDPSAQAPVDGVVLERVFDDLNRTVQTTGELGTSVLTFDLFDRPAIAVDPRGAVAHTGYDEAMRFRFRATYDAATGPVAAYAEPSEPVAGLLGMSTTSYQPNLRRVDTDVWHFDPESLAFIGDGHLTSSTIVDPTSTTRIDDTGEATVTHYDALRREIRTDLPTGDYVERIYADLGRDVTSIRTAPTDSGVVTTRALLNNFYESVELQTEIDGVFETIATTGYDTLGRPQSATSAQGHGVVRTYDGLGRPDTISWFFDSGAPGEVLTYDYDAVGRLSARTSSLAGAADQVTTYAYDWLGRSREVTLPDGLSRTTQYLGRTSLPLQETDRRGVVFDFDYGSQAELTGDLRSLTATGGASSHYVGYEYDDLGRMLAAETDAGSGTGLANERTVRRYDSVGAMLSEHDLAFSSVPHAVTDFLSPFQRDTRYGDDTDTLRFRYTMDSIGRTTEVEGILSGVSLQLSYDGLGGPVQIHRDAPGFAATLVTDRQYDALGRVTSVVDSRAGVELARRSWEIGIDGSPRYRTHTIHDTAFDRASAYQVDEAGRLTAESHGLPNESVMVPTASDRQTANGIVEPLVDAGQWRRYDLDGRDNWLYRDADNPELATAPSVGVSNEYLEFGGQQLGYDAEGALVSMGAVAFSRDLFGRVIAVATPEGTHELGYDALGRLVRHTQPSGEVVRYAYDGLHRVMARDDQGLRVLPQLGLDGYLWVEQNGAAPYFLHQDPGGSVVAVSGGEGSFLESYEYTAFGEQSIFGGEGQPLEVPTFAHGLGFQGHPLVGDFVHMRARMYSPALGRFLSQDPLGYVDGSNTYAFVGNRVLTDVDPLGTRAKRTAVDLREDIFHNVGLNRLVQYRAFDTDDGRVYERRERFYSNSAVANDFAAIAGKANWSPWRASNIHEWQRSLNGKTDADLALADVAATITIVYDKDELYAKSALGKGTVLGTFEIFGKTAVAVAAFEVTGGAAIGGTVKGYRAIRAGRAARATGGGTAAGAAARGAADDVAGAADDAARGAGDDVARAGSRGDGCFVAGTLVATEDGPRPIEEIEVGDRVLSRVEFAPATDWMVAEREGEPTLSDGHPIPTTEDEVFMVDMEAMRIERAVLYEVRDGLVLFGERLFEVRIDDEGTQLIRATGGILRRVE